jgi:hypothetical protein
VWPVAPVVETVAVEVVEQPAPGVIAVTEVEETRQVSCGRACLTRSRSFSLKQSFVIRRMSLENALWGASRIHGELLKLGYEVAQSTVSKYMARGGRSPSQSWKTFLRNHAEAIAAIDMCMVPAVSFERLFAFLVLCHGRRQLLWFEVTCHPTAAWLAQQITEAFP